MSEKERTAGLPEGWRDRFIEIVAERIPEAGQCTQCNTADLTLAQDAVTPIIWNDGPEFGGDSYPQAMIVCDNCGYTKYFNLVTLGIIAPDSEKE